MKLTNHKKNSFYWLPSGSVMHGTIEVSQEENKAICCYLLSEYQKAINTCDTYKRDSLSNCTVSKDKKIFSAGVCASGLIAKRYGLDNYKNDRNYGIKTVNKRIKLEDIPF